MSRSPARARDAGFTLLEILVAITLAALLLGFGYRSFNELSRAEQRRLEENQRDRLAAIVLDRMERELAGTLLLVRPEAVERVDHPWLFAALDGSAEGQDADSLRFVTESPARVGGAAASGGVRIVSYAIRNDRNGRRSLYRAEELLSDRLVLDLPPFEDPPAVEDVEQFNVTLVAEKDGKRLDSWSSVEGPLEDELPGAVELRLQLNDRDIDDNPLPGRVFTRTLALRVRPIGEEEEEGDAQECGGRPTLEECLGRFAEVIGTLDPEAQAVLDEVQNAASDRCFATGQDASAELRELTELLRQLTQLDPEEICQ